DGTADFRLVPNAAVLLVQPASLQGTWKRGRGKDDPERISTCADLRLPNASQHRVGPENKGFTEDAKLWIVVDPGVLLPAQVEGVDQARAWTVWGLSSHGAERSHPAG